MDETGGTLKVCWKTHDFFSVHPPLRMKDGLSERGWALEASPPTPRRLAPSASLSRLSSLVTIRSVLAPVNIQRCRWVSAKLKKPSTVDCTLWPAFVTQFLKQRSGGGEVKLAQARPTNPFERWTNKQTEIPPASKPQQRSQSTFIAVGGFNCVEELTERWMQLCPRFHPNVKRNSVPICWWWHYLFSPLPAPPPRLLPPTMGTHRRCELTGSSDCISTTLAGAEGSEQRKMKKDSWKKMTFKEEYTENIV